MQLFVQDTDEPLEGYGHNRVLLLAQRALLCQLSPHMKDLEGVVEGVEPLSLQAVRSPLDIAHMKDDAGMLLGHPDQTKVERILLGGEEPDVGGALEEGEGGVGLQH